MGFAIFLIKAAMFSIGNVWGMLAVAAVAAIALVAHFTTRNDQS